MASSISSFTDNNYTAMFTVPFEGRNYPFARFSGTSMSAPATTGTIALLLEAVPDLTPAEVRDLLRNTARTDNFTGAIPPGGSTRWGMGKLNAYHAMTEVLGLTGLPEPAAPGLLAWPNPVANTLFIDLPAAATGAELRVIDALGRIRVRTAVEQAGTLRLDASDWPAGLYMLHLAKHGSVAVGKVVRQ